MKKRNLVATVASVALVGVIGIGSTLAYLSANDTALTNTFTFANNITVDLYEYTPTSSGVKEQNGYAYENLVAGQELMKDVDVELNTEVDSYLFVKIAEGAVGDYALELGAIDSGWTKLTNTQDGGSAYAVYGRAVAADGDVDPFDLFDTVTVPDVELSGDTTATLKDVVIDVYAVQADLGDSVTDVASAYTFLTADGTDIFA